MIDFRCHDTHVMSVTDTNTVDFLTHPPYCRIYAPVNWVSIGSDNSLSPIRPQAII